jgi:group I intron endonuclease
MRSGLIYLITNTINGKRYIGQTVKTLKVRWTKHKSAALTGQSDTPLHRAIRKHGPNNFTIEMVAETYKPFLDEVEKLAVWTYQTHGSLGGYNATPGGEGVGIGTESACYGMKHSAETRAKMSASRTGKKRSPEAIDALRARNGEKRKGSASKYIGVCASRRTNQWTARLTHNGPVYVGRYATEVEAAMAVDSYIIEHGLSNTLNFPVSELLVSC